ncbi:uncharacterized protein LOC103576621 [Microplitis demolitor]|uniref:uncharacterized protein LOC103576621 n=1 Tax=Microplitis demolitor TaxID=69319 RepID=UPI0004CD64B0|nr:uncharacterized protein LOC103576621 [Microplitis demolitor]
MAGDLNARNTNWGDHHTNERGMLLSNWIEELGIENKTTLYNPDKPTFPSAGSYLDHCLADSRIKLTGLNSNKLTTLAYDSDHNAITFNLETAEIFNGITEPPRHNIKFNFKKTNWRKLTQHLDDNYTEKLPHDRNLTVDEINSSILKIEEKIHEAINKIVPRAKIDTKKGCQKYTNNKIKKLHHNKTILIAELFKNNNNRAQIKEIIKTINLQLAAEFRKAETAYWEAMAKNINYKDSTKFFPRINRYFRYKEPPRIDTISIKKDNNILLTDEVLNNTQLEEKDVKYIITQPIVKLNMVGKYFETINSPRYTNQGTITKFLADTAAEDVKTNLQNNRINNITYTTFSSTNPAHYPVQEPDKPKLLCTYIQVALFLKKAKNKTSSGLDNIPMIVLKHLPDNMIKDYTIIFNNCFNHSYYPTRWKRAKVIPIKKKDKDSSDPASYRPISLTINISKIFEKFIKIQLMEHANAEKIIPDNQFGFRAKHSTVHAINKFASDINKHLFSGRLVGTVLLDLEKAFDSVWLNGLIYILILLKFPYTLVLLICDMIHGKSFITWDGTNISSSIFYILEGLQQGTVTSPALFIIYSSKILNLFDLNSNNNTHSGAYADDETVYVADSKIPIIQSKLTKLVNQTYHYYKEWNLKINPLKCETILFRKTVNEISPITVPLIKTFKITITDRDTGEEYEIPNKEKVKYLGVHFDYLLRMNKHHIKQLEKTRKAFRANHKIFYNKSIEPKAKLICYQLIVRPILAYAAPIWWNVGPSVMELYRKFERSCIKACLSKYRSAETDYTIRLDKK